jgi:arylsulfatase A-like enzyme
MRLLTPLLLLGLAFTVTARPVGEKPNIVYLMSDELAYYELSHMGNRHLKTPNIDRFAAEGLRFTHAYAGSPVCGPLRCNLMTGKHAGHASVRANDGGTPLRANEATIASVLKDVGYATGGFGKWGAGGRDSTGVPEKHGFDVFFGYYDQVHAHSFYPPYLIRNSEEVELAGNIGGRTGKTYSHHVIMEEGLKFIRENKDQPFFCYLPVTPPHGMYDIPKDDPAWDAYQDEAWIKDPKISQDIKNYAAMVTMIDNDLAAVMKLLRELDLEKKTIVFFTGDNGGQDRFRSKEHPRGFFAPNVDPKTGVEFRGGKGNLYEGGLRIPFLVRWPGKIRREVNDLRFFQPDVFPTLADLAGATTPKDVDGISFLPTLLTNGKQRHHKMLYWEYGPMTAVLQHNWKAVRPKPDQPWELYDLGKDVSETTNIAAQNPRLLASLKTYAEAAHEPVRAGTYSDPTRKRHERDRWAKFGTSRKPMPKRKGKGNRIKAKNIIPPAEMSLIGFSSENRGNDRLAKYAIDGRPGTVWHSQFSPALKKHPHELTIDLGKPRQITGFYCLARQDGGWNGSPKDVEIAVSNQPDSFGEPQATATLEKTPTQQKIDCAPIAGRYVRLRILSEINGKPWASIAEFAVIGK